MSENAYPVGARVRCYRPAPEGRTGVVREARRSTGHWRYRVEWDDGRTPPGYPAETWVGLVNVMNREETER